MTGEDSIALPAALIAPARARAWVAERVAAFRPEVLEDALLVVSELVTNAVRHGRPEIVLSLAPIADGLRIAVVDRGEHVPVLPPGRASLDRPSGRGLLIVAATAREWGIAVHDPGPGKTVWAELAG